MIRAEACAAHGHAVTGTFAAREIEHVAHNHILVGVMRAHAIGRMNRLVVETVEIDRIRAINCHSSTIDEVGDRIDDVKILVL